MLAVAATYFFFLIFAEFAFLHLASAVTTDGSALRWIMLGLGTGGVGGAALAARVSDHNRARALAWGFVACAVSAAPALAASTFPLLLATSVAIGLSLGWATVTLAASLRRATGDAHLGLCIGAGTGLAYAGCNMPAVFHAPPSTQALLAGVIVAAAAFLPVRLAARSAHPARVVEYDVASVVRWTAILMALVWMDSAAFYIVQHTGPLQAATWREPAALWSNAAVHLVVALGGGALLDRGRRGILAVGALAALALACLVLGGKLPPAFRPGWFYSAGVSAYSALLVEYPARSGRASTAAIVFAVAGWFGSALGIGMAQDLNHIPVSFVLAAAALLMAALGWRIRALRRTIAASALLGVVSAQPLRAGETDVIARGREVYIAEGCMHCHSQYVRRRSAQDIAWWGPETVLSDALTASPPLFGTRRQGPDLSNVGSRRSAEWNRLHLIAPQEISPGSRMPSYAYLFAGAGSAGDALVTYLGSLTGDASHELKTPLALIRLNAEKLRGRLAGDAEANGAVSDILEEIAQLNQVIDRLLFLAKSDTGALAPALRPIEADAFVAAFSEDAQALAEDRGIRFALTRNDPGEIRAEPDLLRQLLLNLVANAVAVSKAGALVTLESVRARSGHTFTVEDEGPGLPDAHLARVFERFVRFAGNAEGHRGGHGLGLAICKSIAQLHHGSIRAENRTERRGLRVTVNLPE